MAADSGPYVRERDCPSRGLMQREARCFICSDDALWGFRSCRR